MKDSAGLDSPPAVGRDAFVCGILPGTERVANDLDLQGRVGDLVQLSVVGKPDLVDLDAQSPIGDAELN